MIDTGVTMLSAVSNVIETMGDVMKMFVQVPTVYFTAAAFTSVALGLSRKLIPMRRK